MAEASEVKVIAYENIATGNRITDLSQATEGTWLMMMDEPDANLTTRRVHERMNNESLIWARLTLKR